MGMLILMLYFLTLTACVSTPTLSRDEWLSMTNRTYEGVTKEQAISAAERLMRLADGDDFMIAHSDDGFLATRIWSVYLVLAASVGTDSWMVRAVENRGSGTRVSVSVGTQVGSVSGVVTGPNTVAPLTTPSVGSPVNGTAVCDVFWARMDYLLGRRQFWMDCLEANERVGTRVVWGDNSALCNGFNIKDDVPEGGLSPDMEKKKRELQKKMFRSR
jgi:hypothetical protein